MKGTERGDNEIENLETRRLELQTNRNRTNLAQVTMGIVEEEISVFSALLICLLFCTNTSF